MILHEDEGRKASMKHAERILNDDMPEFNDKWKDE